MFNLIRAVFLLFIGGELLYLLNRFHRFFAKSKFVQEKKLLSWGISSIPIIIAIPVAFNIPVITVIVFNLILIIQMKKA